jgi:hypothetical protein
MNYLKYSHWTRHTPLIVNQSVLYITHNVQIDVDIVNNAEPDPGPEPKSQDAQSRV